MYVLPISGTSGSLSSPVCTSQYLPFTLRLCCPWPECTLTYFIFILWQTCSTSTSAITAWAGLDTGMVTGLVPRFKSFCYALLFRLMPLKKTKERKKKDLDAYRTRLIVNCLVLSASQSHLSASVCVCECVRGYRSNIFSNSSTCVSRLCKQQQMWDDKSEKWDYKRLQYCCLWTPQSRKHAGVRQSRDRVRY